VTLGYFEGNNKRGLIGNYCPKLAERIVSAQFSDEKENFNGPQMDF
jgi:hypothetical protein